LDNELYIFFHPLQTLRIKEAHPPALMTYHTIAPYQYSHIEFIFIKVEKYPEDSFHCDCVF